MVTDNIARATHVVWMQYSGQVELYPRAHYVRVLTPLLPRGASRPRRARIALLPMWLAVIATATTVVASNWVPWFVAPLLSLVIGVAFAGLTFMAHEALHGAIVHGRRGRQLLGMVGFLPFMVSPRLWTAWHNRDHHAHTNLPDDPDAYPTLEAYRTSRSQRFAVDAFSLGGRRWRGGLSLLLGFTVQSVHQLIKARTSGSLSPRQYRLAVGETAVGVVVWTVVAAVVGLVPFLFVFVLPMLVANMIVMGFILTNHSLSPRLSINDPLIGGLSVTTSRWIERLTLGFGYHVEHHLFPGLSSRHAPAVRKLVQQHWPERYQSMSLGAALLALHRTGRVYVDDVTLCDPRTGRQFPTLMPDTHRSKQGTGSSTPSSIAPALAA